MQDFSHSHVNNYKTSIWLIELSLKKKAPYNIPKYLLISLIRINSDEKYLKKLNEILEKKNNKREYYRNINKGFRGCD